MVKTLFVTLMCFSASAYAKIIIHDRYIVFENRSEFESYVNESNPGSKLLPYSDAKYLRAEAVLQRVWAGYKKLFPKDTAKLPAPQIAIQAHDYLDASVNEDPKNPKLAPHAFYMGQRLLEFTDDGLAGVMAHELTHLIFPHFQFRYYESPTDHEPLGYLQSNDPTVEEVYSRWQSVTYVVGPMRIPELNGLPTPYVYDGKLFDIILKLASKLGDTAQSSCQAIQMPYPKWRLNLVLKYISMMDQTVQMTAEQRLELDLDTKEYIANLRNCLGQKHVRLLEFLQSVYHKPDSELEKQYGEYAKVFDRESNVVDGLFAVTNLGFQKLEKMGSQYKMERFRVYSNEEFCDDNSVKVLSLIGFRPNGIEDFFLNAMEDAQPGTKAQCLALIDGGNVPPYGLLTDTHHAACYRVYHSRKFSKYLYK